MHIALSEQKRKLAVFMAAHNWLKGGVKKILLLVRSMLGDVLGVHATM